MSQSSILAEAIKPSMLFDVSRQTTTSIGFQAGFPSSANESWAQLRTVRVSKIRIRDMINLGKYRRSIDARHSTFPTIDRCNRLVTVVESCAPLRGLRVAAKLETGLDQALEQSAVVLEAAAPEAERTRLRIGPIN